nr:hypothetical protein [uncultured Oscillibacter sp.]
MGDGLLFCWVSIQVGRAGQRYAENLGMMKAGHFRVKMSGLSAALFLYLLKIRLPSA